MHMSIYCTVQQYQIDNIQYWQHMVTTNLKIKLERYPKQADCRFLDDHDDRTLGLLLIVMQVYCNIS